MDAFHGDKRPEGVLNECSLYTHIATLIYLFILLLGLNGQFLEITVAGTLFSELGLSHANNNI